MQIPETESTLLAIGTGIAAIGWFFQHTLNGVVTRLERIETKVSDIATQVTSNCTKQEITFTETEKLRLKFHQLEADVIGLEAVQSRCHTCNRQD
jgi:hypothetical protein